MMRGHLLHPLRVAQPPLGHHHGGRQAQPAAAAGHQTHIAQALDHVQCGVAGRSRTLRVGTTHGTSHRDDPRPIANDHDEQHPIDTSAHPFLLATPPCPHQPQLPAVFFEDALIDAPGPLPATQRGGTLVVAMAPQRHQHRVPQAAQARHPSTLGQRAQTLRRQVLVPASHPAQFRGRAAAKKWGKHEAQDCAQPFLLAAQASFDLLDQGVGHTQGMQRVCESLNGSLGPLLIMPQPFVGGVPTALSGFGLFVGVSFEGGPGMLLRTVCLRCTVRRNLCPLRNEISSTFIVLIGVPLRAWHPRQRYGKVSCYGSGDIRPFLMIAPLLEAPLHRCFIGAPNLPGTKRALSLLNNSLQCLLREGV